METIVALATARGRAGVAVVRVSGEKAWEVCQQIAGRVPPERQASLLRLRDSGGEPIDEALVLVFGAGRSFTGEDVCEFQVHGSVAVIGALLRTCLAIPGVRAAEPGEFTRRAFSNGRLDLTQVEALADLIDAETEAQRRQAQAVLDGSARKIIEGWRHDLIESLAMVEAALDFADEELPADLTPMILAPLERVERGLAGQLEGRRAAESVRDGFEVAIIGKVNAGKSSLLNALAGRDAAITSERAGTTRDVIEVRMDIAGMAVTLIDTAGLRESDDEIERMGIERGQKRAAAADLRVYLLSDPGEETPVLRVGDLVVQAKADLWGVPGISSKTGEGIGGLLISLERELADRASGSSIFSRERHFDRLQRSLAHVRSAQVGLGATTSWDMVSEEIRLSMRCLDGIIGKVELDEVLGRIFSSFCIGK